jgi:hypothetical protein
VRGFAVAKISQVSVRVTGGGLIPAEALEMGGWKNDSPNVPDQIWRTLVANRGSNDTRAPSYYRHACLECLRQINRNGDLDIKDLKRRVKPRLPSLANY